MKRVVVRDSKVLLFYSPCHTQLANDVYRAEIIPEQTARAASKFVSCKKARERRRCAPARKNCINREKDGGSYACYRYRIFVHAVCGGRFTALQGQLSSPLYPEPYPPTRACNYSILLPLGNVAKLNWIHMDIEDDGHCAYDYVEVSGDFPGWPPFVCAVFRSSSFLCILLLLCPHLY